MQITSRCRRGFLHRFFGVTDNRISTIRFSVIMQRCGCEVPPFDSTKAKQNIPIMKKTSTYLTLFLTAVIGCTRTDGTELTKVGLPAGDEPVSVSITTGIEDCTDVQVKSIFDEGDIEDKLTEITIAAYRKEGELITAGHFVFPEKMRLELDCSRIYDIYALANMGDMTEVLPDMETDLGSLAYKIKDFSQVAVSGIPMCGKVTDFSPSSNSSCKINLTRLFAKLKVRLLHDGLRTTQISSNYPYTMCNKSIFIRQANSVLRPFSSRKSKAVDISDLMAETDCYANLNKVTVGSPSSYGPGPGYVKDTVLTLYVPENVQGRLLRGNSDSFKKCAENISLIGGIDYSGLCTYLEFNASRASSESGYGGNLTYRYYLGADTTEDFSLERNCRYDITLHFTEDGFFLDKCWKVSKWDDWTDTRALSFMQKDYYVSQGGSTDVFVRYQLFADKAKQSVLKPNDWTYNFDDVVMSGNGLIYSIDKNVLYAGPDSKKHFKFTFSASESATAGSSFPLTINTWDGSISDEATITIIPKSEGLTPSWNFIPAYVAQEGTVVVNGGTKLPLKLAATSGNIINVLQTGETSFLVKAIGTGNGSFTVTDSEGDESVTIPITVKAPVLHLLTSQVTLNPDGTQGVVKYKYCDDSGNALTNLNTAAFQKYLCPTISGYGYFSGESDDTDINLKISSFTDSGNTIGLGTAYNVTVKAKECAQTQAKALTINVSNPFSGISTASFGRMDDYSLFLPSSVNADIRSKFTSLLNTTQAYKYEGPIATANKSCLSARLVPCWKGAFSLDNGTFSISYDSDATSSTGYSFNISRKQISQITTHSAGRHEVMLRLTNPHSGEYIDKVCGTVDLYVHTAIGAEATFGSKAVNYTGSGSKTFSEVYNSIAPYNLFSSSSDKTIYYMDVSLKYLTSINSVYLFTRMKYATDAKQNIFDCLDIATPSVKDGEIKNSMLMSVLDNVGGDRITIGGETYGYRRGIGALLYRALLYPARDNILSMYNLKILMLGMNVNGTGTPAYSPCYDIHNINKGTDPSLNKVNRSAPYYFAPSDMPEYRDADGNGYHVIHFLEELYPETYGWTNLL